MLPLGQHFQVQGHSFSLYGPTPSWQIYIYQSDCRIPYRARLEKIRKFLPVHADSIPQREGPSMLKVTGQPCKQFGGGGDLRLVFFGGSVTLPGNFLGELTTVNISPKCTLRQII